MIVSVSTVSSQETHHHLYTMRNYSLRESLDTLIYGVE